MTNGTATPEHSASTERLWQGVRPEAARRLLVPALSLFAAKGFHHTTTCDIAGRAGMGVALYVYYRTKEDMIFQISRMAHEATRAACPLRKSTLQAGDHRLRWSAPLGLAAPGPLPPGN